MRPLFALLVAAAVVIGTAPVAAAGAAPDASPADIGTGPGPAQTADNGTVTSTPTSNATESGPTASNATETPTGTATDSGNDSNATAAEPGAQLAGVVAVQRTEVESEVDGRAFGQRVAAAASNDSKAAIVASEVNDSRERLAALRDRLAELEAAREAGNISVGRYRANAAQTVAEINAIERRLEQSNETAASLPAAVREANGINASNIDRLRTEARNLSGPEVAAIARSIGGEGSGRGLGDNVGPPGRSGEASGPTGPPAGAGNGNRGPPEDRPGNVNGGDNATSKRGGANGSDGGSGPGNAPDRGNGQGDSSGSPQESAASRNDRSNGDGSGASGGDAGGPDSNPGNGGGNGNGNGGDSSGGGPPNDGPADGNGSGA